MTRAVLDPGVVISGIISPRAAPAALLRAWRAGAFALVAGPALLRELRVVLLRPKFRRFLSEAQALDLVEEIARAAVLVVDPPDPPNVTPDPKDDYLVALALGGPGRRPRVRRSRRPGRAGLTRAGPARTSPERRPRTITSMGFGGPRGSRPARHAR